jgi:hypothetical protein
MKRPSFLFTISAVLATLFSCTQDAYEKGEGTYSLMQADFVEAHSNSSKQIDQALTDDGLMLSLQQPMTTAWTTTADTVYRAVLYYNKVEDGKVEAVSCSRVSVAFITPKDSLTKDMKTDPLRMESVWLAKSRRYLNVGFYLKSGPTDDKEALHHLGIVADTTITHADGSNTLHLQLYHDQGGVPEYYSQRSYVSIPLYTLKADSVSLSINTYEGIVTKQFCIK